MALATGPVIGTGYVPASDTGQLLENVTRRAFIPSMVVQIYQATPMLSAALSNAQTARGGISSVTAPVQGAPLTQAAYTDYGGEFDSTPPASAATAIKNAMYNLKILVVPITFNGIEGLVQDHAAVIPLHEARMNDAGNQAAALLAGDMATETTIDSTAIIGFPGLVNNTLLLGGIDPVANTWWTAGAIPRSAATGNNTRGAWIGYLTSAMVKNQGEMPNMVVVGPGTWTKLAQDFIGVEQIFTSSAQSFEQSSKGAYTNTNALVIAGVPIYMDINFPEGIAFIFHTRYTSFYIHELAAFVFTGFASTLPNDVLGYVGCLVCALDFVTVKRRSISQVATAANPIESLTV
jgi:hypothetical protein